MRFFHLSDLHIGKMLIDRDMTRTQEDVLDQIFSAAEEYRPDAILIAGDIYDRSVPSGEATTLLDRFLIRLKQLKTPVMIIAGNHDSPQRLQYASAFMEEDQIYISAFPPDSREEHLKKLTLHDEHGPIHFYLMPFVKPASVRHLSETPAADYHEAVKNVLDREEIDHHERNVLIAHQFFAGNGETPELSDSELRYASVGGLDMVDISLVRDFDYVALGHIHKSQKVGLDHIRYSGTPIKYSVSERNHKKSITMVTMGPKGAANQYEEIPLVMHPELRLVEGLLADVLAEATEENRKDYVSILIHDENPVRVKQQLEEVYENILEVRIENSRTEAVFSLDTDQTELPDPMTAFAQFYQEVNGLPMDEEETRIMQSLLVSLGEEENR